MLDTDLPCDARAEKVEPAAAPRNTVRDGPPCDALALSLKSVRDGPPGAEQVEPAAMVTISVARFFFQKSTKLFSNEPKK